MTAFFCSTYVSLQRKMKHLGSEKKVHFGNLDSAIEFEFDSAGANRLHFGQLKRFHFISLSNAIKTRELLKQQQIVNKHWKKVKIYKNFRVPRYCGGEVGKCQKLPEVCKTFIEPIIYPRAQVHSTPLCCCCILL